MSIDPEFVTVCGRCGHPADVDPCEQCQAADDTTIVVDMLPVVGGPCNGQTADAERELVHIDHVTEQGWEYATYRRRAFIIGDPSDPEMAHMITVFHLDTPGGLGEAAAILRALVATFALLASNAW